MIQRPTIVRIPRPWATRGPTPAGRHCAACQTEVVSFNQLSQAEVNGCPAARTGWRVCARLATLAVPAYPKRLGDSRRWRWLLAAAVLLGWPPASTWGTPESARPEKTAQAKGPLTIQGVVLDDSLNVPVVGSWLYLNNTRYGAVTNERGEFTITFPAEWKPVRSGLLVLRVVPIPFTFKPNQVRLDLRSYDPALPLTIRLASAPGRGRPNLKGAILMPRPVPPPVYPPSSRTARP